MMAHRLLEEDFHATGVSQASPLTLSLTSNLWLKRLNVWSLGMADTSLMMVCRIIPEPRLGFVLALPKLFF